MNRSGRWAGLAPSAVVAAAAAAMLITGAAVLAPGGSSPVPAAKAEKPVSRSISGASSVLPGQRDPRDVALQAGPGRPAGDSRVITMDVGGRERGYLLLPALGASGTSGLVVVLHQDIGSARAVSEGLGLDGLRRSGIALAYPAGIGGSWNAGTCCGVAHREGVDDVAFVNAVLDDATRRTKVSPQRRGLVGYSGGGMLAYRVMCSPHRPLAAVVEVSGSLEVPCQAVTLPDLLSLHGELDGTVGLTEPIQVTHLGMAPQPVTVTLTQITQAGACSGRRKADGDGVRLVTWSGCRGGSSVDVQVVRGAGHGWESIKAAEKAMPWLIERLGA